MKVEMNSPIARDCHRSGSQDNEIVRKRSSDDVQSLNSWSEQQNLSISTSSSSESGSLGVSAGSTKARTRSRSTPRRPASRHIESTSKAKSFLAKAMPFMQDVFDGSHRNRSKNVNSSSSTMNSGPSRSRSSVFCLPHSTSTNTGCTNTDLSVANSVVSQCENQFGEKRSDQQRNLTNRQQPLSRFHLNECQDSNLYQKSKSAQMYPNLEELKYMDIQGDSMAVAHPLPATIVSSMEESTSYKPFDVHRQNYKGSSKYQASSMHSAQFYQRQNISPQSPTSSHSMVQKRAEVTADLLSQYQNTSHRDSQLPQSDLQTQGNSVDRLHKSQPSISSTLCKQNVKRQLRSSNDLESMNNEYRLEPENVKTKLMSAWNNIKYGWTFKSNPSIKYDSPLYMLGKIYHRRKDDPLDEAESDFLKDFASRIWFTYRRNFYPIIGTKLITDCGWGCMLRSGQMLIAQCMLTHFLGRDWRLYNPQSPTQMTYYRDIIRWFSDPVESPTEKSPFCIHYLANVGRIYNKAPGEWYGPASVAYIFRDVFSLATKTVPVLSSLCLYVAQDCTVYLDDVIDLCTTPHRSESVSSSSDQDRSSEHPVPEGGTQNPVRGEWVHSLIILISMRLGGEELNDIYIPCVKKLLSHENCMGIIGGKPKHSLYFLGWQDDKLIYLDPHFCREVVDTSPKDFRIESFHCLSPRKVRIGKMDPSCTVGFYIKDANTFTKFVEEMSEVASPYHQNSSYPMFIFSKGRQHDMHKLNSSLEIDRGRVKVTHYHLDENGVRRRTFTRESEEFVML